MRRLLLWSVMILAAGYQPAPGADKTPPAKPRARPAQTMRVRWAATAPTKDKTYHAKRMKDNPAIDADWSKAAWKDVEPLVLEYYIGEEPAHQPKVRAKVAYDDENVYVIWRVEDNYVRARCTRHQGRVWLDSCVEFFFTPGGNPKETGYFNLETSCSGMMLFAPHVPGVQEGKFTRDDLAKVAIAGSLKGPIDPEIAKPTTWTLEYRLPVSLLEKHAKAQRPKPGVAWRANFYKCADESSHPHWLTWAPITWPEPQFHLPQFFGTLAFD